MKHLIKPTILFLFAILAGCGSVKEKPDVIIYLKDNWKFIASDSLAYARPEFDDTKWKSILPSTFWERQGYDEYDGYGWYRVRFTLPEEMRDNAYFKDSVQIVLGKIDDTDQTFLNGWLIGQNAKTIAAADKEEIGKFEGDKDAYSYSRRYVLAADDERLLWGKENVLAIRVHDHLGFGGLNSQSISVSMVDMKDYLALDLANGFTITNRKEYKRTIAVKSLSSSIGVEGTITVKVMNPLDSQVVYTTSSPLSVKGGASAEFTYNFESESGEALVAEYRFRDSKSGKGTGATEEVPYILTPKPGDAPRINTSKVYGARPGAPFLFYIAATGIRPMTYAAEGLPPGLALDSVTGLITGSVKKAGEYKTTLKVKNSKGDASKELRIIIGKKMALTPPMGWNSWNCWGLSVSDEKVRQSTDGMVSSGLINHGWTYMNIDDGWEAPQRTEDGKLLTNEKFPDMKALADYVHSKGLKIGIYSSPGPLTCGKYLGSYQYEMNDAKIWEEWGIDYLKYDWCSYSEIAKDQSLEELKKPYVLMYQMLENLNRDIVYSLCQYGMGDVWEWGESVGGNLWRTTGDIVDTWESMSFIGFSQNNNAPYAKPGCWNDPDMLVVGNVGWGPDLHPTRLTVNEQYTHISLWCLLSAPLLLGNDLSKLDDFTLSLLTNDEVIEIDQDPLGKQAIPLIKEDSAQVWVKELEDGTKAAGLFNLSKKYSKIAISWDKLGMGGSHSVRDLWRQKDLGEFDSRYEATVPPHGVVLVRIK